MTAEAGVIMPKRPSTCAGALQQVVANDPLAQRLVSALEPTFGPIVQYAARRRSLATSSQLWPQAMTLW